jgi:uncharacterized protein YndB with AHSA1/START domain
MQKILSGLGILVVIALTLPNFLPSKIVLTRSVEIHSPVHAVFEKLTDLHIYDKWNPFPEGDPTNQTEISGLGLESTLAWKGNKTGEGKMTISGIEQNKTVTVKMEFYKPMAGEGVVKWITSPKSENSTELVWSFEQDMNYFNRYFGLMMDSMMGKHFERGLSNFKALVEGTK